jgi:carboxymethylenebutenolidase
MARGRAGCEVEFGAAGSAAAGRRGYRALPASGRGRGVLVLHQAIGLGEFCRDACDRLAREGFAALAPDLGSARRAAEAPEAPGPAAELDLARAGEELDAAVTELLSCEATEGPRIGALGFGPGGELALLAAARSRRIGAAVDCYGVLPQAPLAGAPLEAAVLGISGERDALLPPARARERSAALEAAGARVRWRIEPGAGHAFLDHTRPRDFDARAAAAAWEALLSFLRAELW